MNLWHYSNDDRAQSEIFIYKYKSRLYNITEVLLTVKKLCEVPLDKVGI